MLALILLLVAQNVSALMRTCLPTFHDKFISGGDEIKMRWEYCTKMTFNRNGFAEWHSMATYRSQDMFDKLFKQYVIEKWDYYQEEIDPSQHLLQLDLAIYDETQWQKIMADVATWRSHKIWNVVLGEKDKKASEYGLMTCEERLSHAIQIDKIKIYPNSTTIVEKTTKRYIQESHQERFEQKHFFNEYTKKFEDRSEDAKYDTEATHSKMMGRDD